MEDLQSPELVRKAVEVAAERQAVDIIALNLGVLNTFTDFFIILSGTSRRHLETLAQELEEKLAGSGGHLHHREGTADSGWVLMDFGQVIVHLFTPQQRAFYRLEELWSAAPLVVRVQ